MSSSNEKRSTSVWRVPLAHVRCGSATAIVAICKLALLFAMFEPAGQLLEVPCESLEAWKVEMANPLEGQAAASRTTLAQRLAVRCVRRASERAGERPLQSSPLWGHRMSNGLCAPLQC